jgi:hypothetical protein
MKQNAKFIVRNRAEKRAKKQKPMKILIRSNQWMTLWKHTINRLLFGRNIINCLLVAFNKYKLEITSVDE